MRLVAVGLLVVGYLMVGMQSAPPVAFEFDSGGADHPEGFGAWSLHLKGDAVVVEHRRGDRVARRVTAVLSDAELVELDRLTEAAAFPDAAAATAERTPDAPLWHFVVRRNGGKARVTHDVRPDRADPSVRRLVQHLAVLIEKYAGERPVLF